MNRKIKVVPYDPNWAALFQLEADNLFAVFRQEVITIPHIRSTAIPSISAKPIIDLLIEVRDIRKIEEFNEKMKELGYQPKGEFEIPGRRFFIKSNNFT